MLNNPTIQKLSEMKLKVMAQMLSEEDGSLRDLSFDERFALMVEKEWLSRKNSKIRKLLKDATLGVNACIEDIDYQSDRTIDKKTINTLSTCTFMEQNLNILITGKTGSGKSFLAAAFGNNACRKGYSAKYYRIPELLLEIQDARIQNRYMKFIDRLQKARLLILDDIGLKSYTLEESRDIREIIESRYNKTSTIFVGQLDHKKWYELFPDPTVADAIMDRIIYNSYILNLESKLSMREVAANKKINIIKQQEML